MNKILLRIGGVINLLFVLFHLAMVKGIGMALAPVSTDVQAIVHMLNIHVAFTLLIFAYLAIFQWHDLLKTRLGHSIAIAIALFWFLRGINQVAFYGLSTPGTLMWAGLCLVFGLLHLIPVIREWKNLTGEAQGQSASAQPAL